MNEACINSLMYVAHEWDKKNSLDTCIIYIVQDYYEQIYHVWEGYLWKIPVEPIVLFGHLWHIFVNETHLTGSISTIVK